MDDAIVLAYFVLRSLLLELLINPAPPIVEVVIMVPLSLPMPGSLVYEDLMAAALAGLGLGRLAFMQHLSGAMTKADVLYL